MSISAPPSHPHPQHHPALTSGAPASTYSYDARPLDVHRCATDDKRFLGHASSLIGGGSTSPAHSGDDSAARSETVRQASPPTSPKHHNSSGPTVAARSGNRDSPSSNRTESPIGRKVGQLDSVSPDGARSGGLSSSAPPASSPVSILSLRSPSTYLDTHSANISSSTGPITAGPISANNFAWSPTTAMFFGHKSSNPPSGRYPSFKREPYEAGPITPSLYTSHGVSGGDGQHGYYPGVNRYSLNGNNIIDGSGTAPNHHSDWNVQHTSWTGLPTPSTEAVLKSFNGGSGGNSGGGNNHITPSINVESNAWEQHNSHSLGHQTSSQKPLDGSSNNGSNGNSVLFNGHVGHVSPAMFRNGSCANAMPPPTPRSVLSGVNNSRSIPRSAGLSWLYQDMGMPNFSTSGNSNSVDQYSGLIRQPGNGNGAIGDHHLQQETQQQANNGGMHPFSFSPQQTTLGRPPLSARAPRHRLSGMDSVGTMGAADWQPGHSNCSHDGSTSSIHGASPDPSDMGEGGQFLSRTDPTYATEEAKWLAVQTRDARASASFFYCVLSTKIFCRTTCPSRRPVRENICFVDTAAEANALGYRACKRCKPDVRGGDPHEARQEILIAKVKERLLQGVLEGGKGKAVKGKGLKYIAEDLGVSHWHLHRCFKKRVNQTPEAWAKAQAKKMRGTQQDNDLDRDDGRDSVGAHSIASSSSILTNGMRGDGLHHHRHQPHHLVEHYNTGPRPSEMLAYGSSCH